MRTHRPNYRVRHVAWHREHRHFQALRMARLPFGTVNTVPFWGENERNKKKNRARNKADSARLKGRYCISQYSDNECQLDLGREDIQPIQEETDFSP